MNEMRSQVGEKYAIAHLFQGKTIMNICRINDYGRHVHQYSIRVGSFVESIFWVDPIVPGHQAGSYGQQMVGEDGLLGRSGLDAQLQWAIRAYEYIISG